MLSILLKKKNTQKLINVEKVLKSMACAKGTMSWFNSVPFLF
jgi:hypothetical protein